MKNRGFAFVEYESHRGRHGAPQAHARPHPAVGPPDRQTGPSPRSMRGRDVMETVKILYVQPHDQTTEDTIKKSQASSTRLRGAAKIHDHAFRCTSGQKSRGRVHAMNNLNGPSWRARASGDAGQARATVSSTPAYQKAAKGGGAAGKQQQQQPSYVYSCDPYTL